MDNDEKNLGGNRKDEEDRVVGGKHNRTGNSPRGHEPDSKLPRLEDHQELPGREGHAPPHQSKAENFVEMNLKKEEIEFLFGTPVGVAAVDAVEVMGPATEVGEKTAFLTAVLTNKDPVKRLRWAKHYPSIVDMILTEKEKQKHPQPLMYWISLYRTPPKTQLASQTYLLENRNGRNWLPDATIIATCNGTQLDERCQIGEIPYWSNDGEWKLLLNLRQNQARRAKRDKDTVLMLVSGESGSGKTMALLGIAEFILRQGKPTPADRKLIFYFEAGALGLEAVEKNFKARPRTVKEREARNAQVLAVLKVNIIETLIACNFWPEPPDQKSAKNHYIDKDGDRTIAIVIDELGGYPAILRALCCIHTQLAQELREFLKVGKVFILCGGTGADPSSDVGSNPDDYFLHRMSPLTDESWKEWLKHGDPAFVSAVEGLIDGPLTKVVLRLKSLLSNWRMAACLMDQLRDCVDQGINLGYAPREVEACMTRAMHQYKGMNALCRLSFPDACAVTEIALALQLFSWQEPIDDYSTYWKLVSTHGLLVDNGGMPNPSTAMQGDGEPISVKRRAVLGRPRYTMSPALQTMTSLGFGLRGEIGPSGECFEQEIGVFFSAVLKAAFVLPHREKHLTSFDAEEDGPMHPSDKKTRKVAALLPNPWREKKLPGVQPHGLQLDYGQSVNDEFFAGEAPQMSERVPILDITETVFSRLPETFVISTRVNECIAPPTEEADLKLLKEFARSPTPTKLKGLENALPWVPQLLDLQQESACLVVQNAPKAPFADLIIVNNLTKELWLVQCKCLTNAASALDSVKELEKMGYGPISDSGKAKAEAAMVLRKALEVALKMETVRYFFCISFPAKSLHIIHSKLAPIRAEPNVHVLCDAYGFRFDPVDRAYMNQLIVPGIRVVDRSSCETAQGLLLRQFL